MWEDLHHISIDATLSATIACGKKILCFSPAVELGIAIARFNEKGVPTRPTWLVCIILPGFRGPDVQCWDEASWLKGHFSDVTLNHRHHHESHNHHQSPDLEAKSPVSFKFVQFAQRPGNLLFAQPEVMKLADFGCATLAPESITLEEKLWVVRVGLIGWLECFRVHWGGRGVGLGKKNMV